MRGRNDEKKALKKERGISLGHEHRSWRGRMRAEIEGTGVGAFGRIRRLQNQSRRKKNRRRRRWGSEERPALVRLHLQYLLRLS